MKLFGSKKELSDYLKGTVDQNDEDQEIEPIAPDITENTWYETQSDIMRPALRAQEKAAVQQQVREVMEDTVLKIQTIVDTWKRSAHDSFLNTEGLMRYAVCATLQCMSQASPRNPPVELSSSSYSSLSSSSSLTQTSSSSCLKRTWPSASSSSSKKKKKRIQPTPVSL